MLLSQYSREGTEEKGCVGFVERVYTLRFSVTDLILPIYCMETKYLLFVLFALCHDKNCFKLKCNLLFDVTCHDIL
jgi:hypothetical protein